MYLYLYTLFYIILGTYALVSIELSQRNHQHSVQFSRLKTAQ